MKNFSSRQTYVFFMILGFLLCAIILAALSHILSAETYRTVSGALIITVLVSSSMIAKILTRKKK